MNDLISRQDAIDAISTWDKFGVDERSRVVRWHEGLEPYVKLRDVVWAIEKQPSAEPEIIRCKDCKHSFLYAGWDENPPRLYCDKLKHHECYDLCVDAEGFCYLAERGTG